MGICFARLDLAWLCFEFYLIDQCRNEKSQKICVPRSSFDLLPIPSVPGNFCNRVNDYHTVHCMPDACRYIHFHLKFAIIEKQLAEKKPSSNHSYCHFYSPKMQIKYRYFCTQTSMFMCVWRGIVSFERKTASTKQGPINETNQRQKNLYVYNNGTICQKLRLIPFQSDSIKYSVTVSNCVIWNLNANAFFHFGRSLSFRSIRSSPEDTIAFYCC